jgi:3-phosphoshikimate 1-carboxyvinyltransferase
LPDGLWVEGQRCLPGGTVDACGDHRIAMAAAICAPGCEGPVTIRGAEATEKSYAGFWKDYVNLGGCLTWEEEP